MRRLLLAALVAGLAASAAFGAPRRANDRIACEDVKTIDLYFWPQGHGVIPAFGPDSALPAPHMEIYRAGVTASTGLLGFVGTTSWKLSARCRSVGDEPFVRWGAVRRTIVTKTARIRCRFARAVELKTSLLATGGSRLQITVLHTGASVVDAAIRNTGSQVTYRTKLCRRIALLPGSTAP
ncbi:MAG TPA: hypothetical protein VF101_10740 [Gaiellaceae bacterium]